MAFALSIFDMRSAPRCGPARGWKKGFTFTEVLFAVMLLGIGFIMVAALFPVAIQQSQASRDDLSGVVVAKRGIEILRNIRFTPDELLALGAGESSMNQDGRYDGQVHLFDDFGRALRFTRIVGNLVDRADTRYAWVPVGYKLKPWPTIRKNDQLLPIPLCYEVYLVAVACRTKAAYDNTDMDPRSFTFRPRQCYFVLSEAGGDADLITFSSSSASVAPADFPAAAEGAYVIIANDQVGGPAYGRANGRMYRLGVKRDDKGPGVWELMAGHDMALSGTGAFNENIPPRAVGAPASGRPAVGFMIGRGLVDSMNLKAGFDGVAQDLFATSVLIYFE